jgi:hypothetical protein
MSHPRTRLSPVSAVLIVLAVASIAALSVSAAVAANPQTLKWTFDHDLEGWHPGGVGPRNSTDWGFAAYSSVGGGVAVLDGRGDPSQPNSWIFRAVDVPVSATRLTFDVSAEIIAGSSSSVIVRIVSGDTSSRVLSATVRNSTNHLSFTRKSIDISRWAGHNVTIYIEENDNTPAGSIGFDKEIYVDNVTIVVPPRPTPTPAFCDFAGIVRDGDLITDGHDNPLVGVPVELFSNGSPIAGPAVTGSDGHYCLSAGGATPGNYEVRASLIDGEHTPPIYVTTHASSPEPVFVTKVVTAEDFGRQDFDVTFSATVGQPWLADVANVHWQSGRFVDWLLDRLVLDPARLAGLTIETAAGGTKYSPSSRTVFISANDTPYAARQDSATNCPENCEWHEIAHHVAAILGIAPVASCLRVANHGGWLNSSTCDSLAEGFPAYLATLASLDIDAGRGAGYATPDYSVFRSLEDNGWRPWSFESGDWNEDLAVAQLLWDLADDTPTETETVPYYVGNPPGFNGTYPTATLRDRVALQGINLVELLAFGKPATVADIYEGLLANPAVPAAIKAPDLDLDGDGTPDLSPLAEIFVLHGFRPAEQYFAWKIGDPVSQTQPGSSNLALRRQIDPIKGSAVRLWNASAAPMTFSIDITYPSTTSRLDVVVAASSDRIVEIVLPPYWSGILPADGSLPACANPDAWPVSLKVSAPGTPSRTLSSCEFLHLIPAATNGAAFTFEAGVTAESTPHSTTGSPASAASPIAIWVLLIVLGAIAALTAGVFVARRRRSRAG